MGEPLRRGVERRWDRYAYELHDGYQVAGPALGDRGGAQGELQDQVPPYKPGHELPEGGVGERVGAAGDGHGGGELRVAERGQGAGHSSDDVGEGYGGSGVPGRRLAGENEQARADDHADAEDGKVQGTQRLV